LRPFFFGFTTQDNEIENGALLSFCESTGAVSVGAGGACDVAATELGYVTRAVRPSNAVPTTQGKRFEHNEKMPADVNTDGQATLADARALEQAIHLCRILGLGTDCTKTPGTIDQKQINDLPFLFKERFGSVDVDNNGKFNLDDLEAAHDELNGAGQVNSFWQNPVNQHDVDRDGQITLADAEAVVKAIVAWEQLGQGSGNTRLPDNFAEPEETYAFFDTYGYVDADGDQSLTIADLELVHDELNGAGQVNSFWQNPVNQHDVDRDGQITLADAEAVVKAIVAWEQLGQGSGNTRLPDDITEPEIVSFFNTYGYVDADGDQALTSKDLELVHDELNGAGQVNSFWQNPVDKFDVDGDGTPSTPTDVRQLVNASSRGEEGALPSPPTSEQSPPPYLDVNGDGFFTPQDINVLRGSL